MNDCHIQNNVVDLLFFSRDTVRLSQPCGEDFRAGVGYPGKGSINCIGAARMTFLSLLLVSACTTLRGDKGDVRSPWQSG